MPAAVGVYVCVAVANVRSKPDACNIRSTSRGGRTSAVYVTPEPLKSTGNSAFPPRPFGATDFAGNSVETSRPMEPSNKYSSAVGAGGSPSPMYGKTPSVVLVSVSAVPYTASTFAI